MKGEILCEGEILGGEFSLLFFVIFLLVNKIFYFLPHLNSWFLTVIPQELHQDVHPKKSTHQLSQENQQDSKFVVNIQIQ